MAVNWEGSYLDPAKLFQLNVPEGGNSTNLTVTRGMSWAGLVLLAGTQNLYHQTGPRTSRSPLGRLDKRQHRLDCRYH